jgi:CcmD family protein
LTTAEKYVLAAFLVVFAVVLAYVVIYAFKLSRLERELAELSGLAERRRVSPEPEREPVAR